jgi:hypothetical protein
MDQYERFTSAPQRTNHGRLSSASTGKFAALRLPLDAPSEENLMSLDGGTSTSISSSKSDILAPLMILGFCVLGFLEDWLPKSRGRAVQERLRQLQGNAVDASGAANN